MKKIITALAILAVLVGCTPKPEQIAPIVAETLAAWPTQTAFPTYTPNPTYTDLPPLPTYTPAATLTPRVIVVTATGTPTLQYTATITNTPEPTKDRLKSDKGAGIYLVGVDIAPGVWRSQAKGDNCYWSTNTKTGDIIDNHFGMAGGTMYIPATAFSVTMEAECGRWVYLGQ